MVCFRVCLEFWTSYRWVYDMYELATHIWWININSSRSLYSIKRMKCVCACMCLLWKSDGKDGGRGLVRLFYKLNIFSFIIKYVWNAIAAVRLIKHASNSHSNHLLIELLFTTFNFLYITYYIPLIILEYTHVYQFHHSKHTNNNKNHIDWHFIWEVQKKTCFLFFPPQKIANCFNLLFTFPRCRMESIVIIIYRMAGLFFLSQTKNELYNRKL